MRTASLLLFACTWSYSFRFIVLYSWSLILGKRRTACMIFRFSKFFSYYVWYRNIDWCESFIYSTIGLTTSLFCLVKKILVFFSFSRIADTLSLFSSYVYFNFPSSISTFCLFYSYSFQSSFVLLPSSMNAVYQLRTSNSSFCWRLWRLSWMSSRFKASISYFINSCC